MNSTNKKYILAVDPGVRGCGVAFAVDSKIQAAAYVLGASNTKIRRAEAWMTMANAVFKWWRDWCVVPLADAGKYELIIELPQVYAKSHQVGVKSKADPNDLIELAATVGAITQTIDAPVVVYLPAEWKGQVPKAIMHDRARARLTADELETIQRSLPRAALAHNVWDAAAMLLKHCGRW